MRAITSLLLLGLVQVASALCSSPATCRLIGVAMLTFLLSVGQLIFLVTLGIVLGITICNKRQQSQSKGTCCGCEQGFLLALAIPGLMLAVLQSWWTWWVADALNDNSGESCSIADMSDLPPTSYGAPCEVFSRNYTDWNNVTGWELGTPANYTTPGYQVYSTRWDDLWTWFAWNLFLAVADAVLSLAAIGWRHALLSKDETLKNRIEGFADYGTGVPVAVPVAVPVGNASA